MPRRDAGVFHLVVALGVEADRKRSRRLAGQFTHDAGDRRTVGAAAEETADAPPLELARNAVAQQAIELLSQFVETLRCILDENGFPPSFQRHLAAIHQHIVRGRQARDAGKSCARCGDDVEEQVVEDRLRLDVGGVVRNLVRPLAYRDAIAIDPIAQRMKGEAVDRGEAPAARIFQMDGEVALDRMDHVFSKALKSFAPRAFATALGGDASQVRIDEAVIAADEGLRLASDAAGRHRRGAALATFDGTSGSKRSANSALRRLRSILPFGLRGKGP
jgi:hypothetical protein